MSKAIKNHIIDCLIDTRGKWLTSDCFFIKNKLVLLKSKGIESGRRLSSTMQPIESDRLDKGLKKMDKREREKIKFVYTTGNYEQLKRNLRFILTTNEQQKREVEIKEKEMKNEFKLGLFKLVTETGKNVYFSVRYLGFLLYQIGVKEDYLIEHAFYYPSIDAVIIYSRSNKYILAGLKRVKFDYTDDLLYPEFENSVECSGIDYGNGQTNIDLKNGIRYGCISQNSVGQAWYDSSEPFYPCKECEYRRKKDKDLYCDNCKPSSWYYKDKEYLLESCMDTTDVIVFKSPYFTYAQLCSPCVPGACNLDRPLDRPEQENRSYCLGHDWFENEKAPYPVFDVKTGQLVNPKQ